jgi:hypothetical protein
VVGFKIEHVKCEAESGWWLFEMVIMKTSNWHFLLYVLQDQYTPILSRY